MEIYKFIKKIKSRGYWLLILEPIRERNEKIENNHPRDKYDILKTTNVQYRGWPTPFFPSSFPEEGNFLKISENITGGIDWEHYKEIFTLFESGQFTLLSSIPEDWIDESKRLQGSDLNQYKQGEILSFVSATYYITEIFVFIKNLINSNLYKEIHSFRLKLYFNNTDNRKLKAFGNRIGFFHEYKSTSTNIKVFDNQIEKESFSEAWETIAKNSIINFYKYFGTYDPSASMIETDIKNLLERRV